MSEVNTTLLSVLHSMLTSRSQIWYTIFVGPSGPVGPLRGPRAPRHLPGLPLISYATGQWDVNNLPKVVAQQRHGRGSNLRPLDRKSDTLPSAEVEQNKCVGVAIATFDVWKRTMDRNNQSG